MNAPAKIGVQIHCDYDQGSDKWLQARCGLLTASEFDRIITPTLKIASNAKERAHLWELAAQRISRYVEPQYISDAMLRGQEDEIRAREEYAKRYSPVQMCGFVTNSKWGFTLGCSPDGLVGDDGLIEVKSRGQRFQVQNLYAAFRHEPTAWDELVEDWRDFIAAVRRSPWSHALVAVFTIVGWTVGLLLPIWFGAVS